MILQSLVQLFDRLKDEPEYNLPTPGYSVQNITFRIVLNPDGSVVDIQDARETITETTKSGKTKSKSVPRQTLVPGDGKPPGAGINPCTLWDNTAYLLGYKKPDKDPKKTAKEADRALETFAATQAHYLTLTEDTTHPALTAIRSFYQSKWEPKKLIVAIEKTKLSERADEINASLTDPGIKENERDQLQSEQQRVTERIEELKSVLEELEMDEAKIETLAALGAKLDDFAATGFGIFRVLPSHKDTHQEPEIKDWLKALQPPPSSSAETTAFCLVTGKELPIARLHDPAIKGVNGAAPGGAKLASFNLNPFESYAKDQSYNSPVSEPAVFAYCNALNALLSGPQSHRHRVTIGDVTTIFWTEKKTTTESLFAHLLSGNLETEPESITTEDQTQHRQLEALLNILRRGGGASLTELNDDPNTKFYLLGLSGNVTRLVVRFWHVSTIGQMLKNLQDHYQNLALTRKKDPHPFWEPEFPSAQRLLDQSARERKAISPLLGGQLMQSILHRTPYPMTLLQGVLNRLRANDPVDYLKAAILKAFLIRNFNQTIEMSLNTERTEPAYLLGRLFAALEKTQEDALGKVNAGIRERFYSSASATPGSVFPRILRTYQHHLAKMDGGMKTNRERLVQAIHGPLDGYPSHLTLEQQGLFAIGYYHQRQDFFTKKEKPETQEPATA